MKGPTRDRDAEDPLAICSLPADDLGSRLRWIRDEILPHVVTMERLAQGVALELEAAPGVEAKLDQLIELERECCSGIDFSRSASSAPGRLRLEIHGVDPNASIFQSLQQRAAPSTRDTSA